MIRYHWEIRLNGQSIASCLNSSDIFPIWTQIKLTQGLRAPGLSARKVYR